MRLGEVLPLRKEDFDDEILDSLAAYCQRINDSGH
jgi:hypothetical protein